MLFGLFALMVVLLQGWRAASGWSRFKLYNTAMVGIATLAIALLFIHVAVNKAVFTGAVVLYGAGFGFVFPTILVMVMQGISIEKKGIIM